jgi:hypothetical protein
VPSPGTPPKTNDNSSGLAGQVIDLRDLVIAYLRQETTGHLKGLQRWIGFGLGGAMLICIGTLFVVLGVMRGLQTEIDSSLSGNWSWVPYVAGAALALLVAAGCAVGIARVDRRLDQQGAKRK